MLSVWIYSLVSVFVISLVAFIGLITLPIGTERLKKILIYFISFSAGALFGGAFLHLLPEISEGGVTLEISVSIIFGVVLFFSLEKLIHWRHCHMPITKNHVHSFAYMNLIGDALHNLLDGVIIGASYLISIPAGLATTIAVLFHEIPQEIGDFGVLVYAGFSKKKAVLMNFLTALTSVLGVVLALVAYPLFEGIEVYLVAIAIGGFIYIAGSDLIPELHKDARASTSLIQIITFILGVLIMALLMLLE